MTDLEKQIEYLRLSTQIAVALLANPESLELFDEIPRRAVSMVDEMAVIICDMGVDTLGRMDND